MDKPAARQIVTTCCALLWAMMSVSTWSQTYSEPEDDYLHEIVQSWTAKTSAENLRAADFAESDIEVRIWAGFGLRGTSGGILRKRGERWFVSFLELDRYWAGATDEIAVRERMLPPCIVESMQDRCVVDPSFAADGTPDAYSLYCAHVVPSPRHNDQQELARLWETLAALGIRELPPMIERDWIATDGHSYVIEVRDGNDYRATVVRHANESEADEQIHRVVSAFDAILGTDLFGGAN